MREPAAAGHGRLQFQLRRVRPNAVIGVLVAALAAACGDPARVTSPATGAGSAQRDAVSTVDVGPAPARGITLAPSGVSRGFDGAPTPSTRGTLPSHGSSWMDHTNTYAIFWGTSWNTDPTFTGDKISSVESFLSGFGGSVYANTVTEYGPSNASSFSGTIVDNSAAPAGDPGTAYFGSYVCSLLGSRGLGPNVNGVYFIYTTTRYTANANGYLGYHGSSSCGGVTIKIAVIFNQDGSGFVTDPYHYHSDNAAALVNTTAHELTEAITDAVLGNGWFAGNTAGEIADKCNFSFGPSPYVTLTNGAVFKLQGEWSNGAYSTGTGFANGNSPAEYGCVNSRPVPAPRPTIVGPYQVWPGYLCTYTASVANGTPPFLYSWGGAAYTTSSTLRMSTSSDFYLTLRVKDANGIVADAPVHYIHVYQYGLSCQS